MRSEFKKRIEYVSDYNYESADEIIDDLFEQSEMFGVIPIKEVKGFHFVSEILIPATIATFLSSLRTLEDYYIILMGIALIYFMWVLTKWSFNYSERFNELPLALAVTKENLLFIRIVEKHGENGRYYELQEVEEISYQYPNINKVLRLKRKGNDIFKKFSLILPSGGKKNFEIKSRKKDTSIKYFKENVISSKGLLTISKNFDTNVE